MNVVVTGASGFVGRALTRALRDAGAAVTPLARRNAPGTAQVADYAQAPAADVLVHLAETGDRRQAADGGPALEQASARTMEALLAKGYRRVVYASSAVLYGDQHTEACRPDFDLHIGDAYARIKRAGELAVLAHDGVAARLVNLFGPGMSSGNVLAAVLGQIPGSDALRVMDAAPVRDFLWVDDAASAIAAMALGSGSGVFNVGSGSGTSVRDLARTALELAGQPDREIVSTAPGSRRSSLFVDIGSTRSAFGWQPATTLRDGLAHLLKMKQEGKTWASAQ